MSFVEYHRLKCRVNVLMQNYDKNPKNRAKYTKFYKIKIGATQWVTPIRLLLLIAVYQPYFTSSNIKYIDNQLVTVIKIQMICKCKYKTI